jgi:hypothetical protein
METSYKAKYQQLKLQYMHSVDVAFRLGYEQGAKEAQMDQMMQQQQEQQAMEQEQAAAMGDPSQGGAPQEAAEAGQEPQVQGQEQMEPASEHPDGSELDQHIAKLEGMLGKSEPEEMAKALHELKSFRKSQLQAIELKKSYEAINGISKALHKPAFKLSRQASHNMNSNAKTAVSLQHKIVDDVMKKWEEEEHKAAKNIHQIISVEGLTKKE